METGLIEQRISCPYCAEPMDVVIDVSAGGQSYVEDCQVCCQPMQVSFDTDGEGLAWIHVDRAQ